MKMIDRMLIAAVVILSGLCVNALRGQSPSSWNIPLWKYDGTNYTWRPTGTMTALTDAVGGSDTLQDVVSRGGTVTNGVVTIDAANDRTNRFGGYLTVLGERVVGGYNYDIAPSVAGIGGLAFGGACEAGAAGIAVGVETKSDSGGAAFGFESEAGKDALAAGVQSVAGERGFAAGNRGKGAPGSFVFSDGEEADFNRLAYTNWFSVRAGGGTYYSTPTFEVTGDIEAASFTLDGDTITEWPTGGTYTNLFAGAGTTGSVYSAAGDVEKYLRGDGTWQDALTEDAADALYVAITDGVATNLETAGTNFWSSGRVHYLPIDADINAYIASAAVQDGDVVELGAGTNTVTGKITIGKSIHLRGQGKGVTTIACSTDLGTFHGVMELAVSNVKISDMSITVSGQTHDNSAAIKRSGTSVNLTGWRFERLIISYTSAGSAVGGIQFRESGGDVVDCDITVETTSVLYSRGAVWTDYRTQGTSAKTVNIVRSRLTMLSPQGNAYGVFAYATSAPYTNTMNVIDCIVTATGSGVGYGTRSYANNNINIYGGRYDATTYDLYRGEGTLTVHGPVTLANGTTSGTITYAGTTAMNRAHVEGPVRLANTTKPTAATGYGWIYAKTNEVYVLDGAGNETLISPHGGSDKWSFISRNDYTGREIIVDMESMIRTLERVSGEKIMTVNWREPSRDWAADEAAKVARIEAEIAAWDAEAERRQFEEPRRDGEVLDEPLPEMGERPEPYTPRPVPAWITERKAERQRMQP